MRNHKLFLTIAAIFCFLMISCATTNAPQQWLSEAEQVGSDGFGGWVDIRFPDGRISGELIAVTEDTLFFADSMLRAVAAKEIVSARVASYHASSLAGFVFLGTLSTVSNGFLLIFTAPMWLIGGSAAAGGRSYEPIVDYPESPLNDFRRFARFPQGLPPQLDRSVIAMKPLK